MLEITEPNFTDIKASITIVIQKKKRLHRKVSLDQQISVKRYYLVLD